MSEEIKVLKLGGALLNKLPDNFSFNGTLDLTGSSLKELPKDLFVQEDLIIGDADIHYIPEGTIIGGNLIDYSGQIKVVHESAIICGKFYFYDDILQPNCNSSNYIVLENGEKFYYKNSHYYSHRALRDHEFDRTPFEIYYGYSPRNQVVRWETPQGVFIKYCKDKTEAKFFVNHQDAIERGLDKYRGLDIDTPMLGHDILEIYQVCTHSCMPMVQEYLNRFNFDLNSYYTLREIGYAVQQFKSERYAPASDVFMNFFNIPKKE